MPGVLIDDLPFSLDSVSSSSSPFFESLCGQQASSPSGFYSQGQLGPLLSPLSSSNCLSMSEATAKSTFQQQQQQLKFVNMSLDRPQAEHCQYLDEQHQQHLDAAAALWMNASSSSNRFFNGNSNSTSNISSSSINGDVVKDLLMEAMAASGSSSCESPRASPTAHEALAAALHKFLPSNNSEEAAWSAEDLYSCDEFRMFEFKVRRCMRGRSHDWTECPFAHPGEKARRRDPRRFHYSGTACPDFRKGNCKNGDACELAHGVFECWLHPARYRTQPCKDGRNCKRRVCFFAHTPEQLRLLPAAAQAAAAVSSSSSGSSCSSPKSSSSLRSGGGGGSGSPLFRSFSDNNSMSGDRIGEGSSGYCCHHHHQYVGSPRHHLVGCGGSSCSGHSCCRMLSSPTSTLVGLAHSPPPLSPPLSPSVSPPQSPSSASLSMSMAASGVARGALFSQQQQQQQSSSPGSSSSAQRRHLERLASLEHQHQQQQRRPLMHSYPSAPSSPGSSHHHHSPFSSSSSSSNHGGSSMSDLVSALQQLELKGGSGAAGGGPMWMQQLAMANQSSSSSNQQQQYTTGPSPLRPSNTMGGSVRGCSSMSLPGTPTKPRWDCGGMWEMDVGEDEEDEMAAMASPRVESGRDLRAKIYGRLVGKKEAAAARLEPCLDMEAAVAGEPSPDLNWVNELVTE